MSNQFGERIKKSREGKGLLQRQVSIQLDIDVPMLSKIEHGERKAKKQQIKPLAKILKENKDELYTLWLADQIVELLENEELALKAIQVAEEEVKYHLKKKKNRSVD